MLGKAVATMLRTVAGRSLIGIASCQLRHLLQWTPTCVSVATQQPHRCCTDDSKKRGRSKTSKDSKNKDTEQRTSTKASGPAVNLLERDLHNILSERQQPEKLQERSTLQRRIDLVLSLGCTMDQIQRHVQILNLTEQVILQRATVLKEMKQSPISVALLLSTKQVSLEQVERQLQWKDQVDQAFCKVLRCSPAELARLKTHHPFLERLHNMRAEEILKKEELLHRYGVTTEEIQQFPAILKTRMRYLQERLDLLTKLRDEGKIKFEHYPLQTLADRTRTFDLRVKHAVEGRREIDGSQISMEAVAKRLGTTAKDIEDASFNFFKLSPSRVIEKIDYLLEQGVSRQEVLSHIYIMRYHHRRLKWAMEQSRAVTGGSTSVYIFLSFLRSGRLPRRSYVVSRQRMYVATLLGVKKSELPLADTRPLWSTDRVQIKRNHDFLLSQGFSSQDILSCIFLLAHDSHSLQAYYQGLWDRPEVVEYSAHKVWTHRKKVLALLQYIIERDMNFTSVMFVADVEYEQGSHDWQRLADSQAGHSKVADRDLESHDPDTLDKESHD